MHHAIHWFEIPSANLERAAVFYEKALSLQLKRELFGQTPMAIFPATRPDGGGSEGVSGAVILDARREPSPHGTIVYLNAGSELDAVLARVPDAGGRVVMGRTDIGPPGFIAVIGDTEGNLVGLHMPKSQ